MPDEYTDRFFAAPIVNVGGITYLVTTVNNNKKEEA